ncbi:hypothetical protein QN382_14675 [Pseudomonas sp. 10B1]|uniref:hypothetical protein n=1 Tax=unclassified Pseudomonas TaxID=196821 RepID=UPI002AB42889|nr:MULTISPECIES: hypothetical protein [unclassified Pseudomonas]MDY7561519.1 hypothetical protein [Pseudomonas sp. AB6]MEA9979178.1 hypothetical protein [Pseudomonas sp. RTS4]MEA9994959.1 hypothetical protein [Pseudomonas sp. AA4]MEB0088221.1 hypothetical protein [Pseudomonas sp. RTI1]MEB0127095.1 hypothetical protein [Pseudomonas sp. CCC1.2]
MTGTRKVAVLRVFNLMLMVLAVLLMNTPRSVLATESNDNALVFVQQHHLGDSLAWLGFQVASRTATFAGILQKVGKVQGQTLVQNELQRLQPIYQEQWNRNLAAAYRESFSPSEMRTLNQNDVPKELATKFQARQKDVGMSMKAKSAELLKTFVAQVLLSAQTKLSQ